jgi:multiple antibiotic resistance protein
MNFSSLILTLCLMAIPTSSIPTILSLIKDFDAKRQRWILFREALFSMLLAFIFLFIGKPFLKMAEIETYALNISGGALLFLIALRMIFPERRIASKNASLVREPFVFPIATPLLSGGGVLTVIIVCAQQTSLLNMSIAISIVWSLVILVMLTLPLFYEILGRRGLIVIENLMGMILLMRACDLIQVGISLFLRKLHP